MVLAKLLQQLEAGAQRSRNFSTVEAEQAFSAVLSGQESEVRVAAFLVAMRMKGATVEELVGFARAARARTKIPCEGIAGLVCICPPHCGVDRFPPLEVAAGLIAAGAGARVLILTDRCVPPHRGLTSASVLEALGAGLTWDPLEAEDWVLRKGFAACAVTGMLPPLLGLRNVRQEVGMRTPLSTVEKLLAPSSAAIFLGAQGGAVLGQAVEVMQELGFKRGLALQGPEGSVVPSTTTRTRGIELSGNHLLTLSVEPEDFGLEGTEEPELPLFFPPPTGRGSGDNKALVKASGDLTVAVLAGERGPARNSALLAAGLILKCSGRCMTLAEGVDEANRSLDSGAAKGVLAALRATRP